MFFLLRTAFWVSILLLVLPLGGGEGPSEKDRASIDAMSALAAAGATVSDMTGFCARQPDACAVGSQAMKVVGERAMTGAALIQDYLGGEPGAAATPAAAAPAAARAVARTPGSRDTLTPADRKPGWRGGSNRSA